MWLWLGLGSGLLLGLYDIFRKRALQAVSLLNVLALYCLFCFLMVSFSFRDALKVGHIELFLIFIKSVILFLGWIMGFLALRGLPISIATPLDVLTPVFSVLLGVVALHERLGFWAVMGIMVTLGAYFWMGKVGKIEIGNVWRNKFFYLMMACALCSATTAMMDKIIMKTADVNQMQFWFYFFITVLYFGALWIVRSRQERVSPFKFHYAILLMAVFLVAADRLYFIAVHNAASQISVLLPLRRISILVSAIGGGIIFKEKNIQKKLGCLCIALLGIALIFIAK